jgi:hypothetical protein
MYGNLYKPKWTYVFIGICVIAFILEQFTDYWIYFSFIPSVAFDYPWMFVTSIFLHADLSHLFFNMLALFFFGTYLERRVGGRTFVVLFLLSGIVGNIGFLLTTNNPLSIEIGASGAIYGVIGALAIIAPFTQVFVYGLIPIPLILVAALWALIDLQGLFVPSGIAYSAHIAGMLIGITFGIYFRSLSRPVRVYY